MVNKKGLIIHKLKGLHNYIMGKCSICGQKQNDSQMEIMYDHEFNYLIVPYEKATVKDIQDKCLELYNNYVISPKTIRMSSRACLRLTKEVTTNMNFIQNDSPIAVKQLVNTVTGDRMMVELI